jgi:ABC-2 type transport system ATP-binding protein
MQNIIELINVSKKYEDKYVLKNISAGFKKGQIHGIIGRNGSGKTVLFKCICGFIHLTSGSIVINDLQVGKDIDIPNNIGMIIENPGFLPGYSGFTNLKLLADISKKSDKQRIKEVMAEVGLHFDDSKHVSKYSLGMRQRLGLAQALLDDPEILILDEPMNGLDNHGVDDIRKLLLDLKDKQKTILIASHSKEDIEILCDTVHEIDSGIFTEMK